MDGFESARVLHETVQIVLDDPTFDGLYESVQMSEIYRVLQDLRTWVQRKQ